MGPLQRTSGLESLYDVKSKCRMHRQLRCTITYSPLRDKDNEITSGQDGMCFHPDLSAYVPACRSFIIALLQNRCTPSVGDLDISFHSPTSCGESGPMQTPPFDLPPAPILLVMMRMV